MAQLEVKDIVSGLIGSNKRKFAPWYSAPVEMLIGNSRYIPVAERFSTKSTKNVGGNKKTPSDSVFALPAAVQGVTGISWGIFFS